MSANAWAKADPTVCPICDRDSCDDPAHGPERAPSDTARPRLAARPALELMAAPGPLEIVEGLAWEDSITVMVSESGAGKTFAALDLSGAVAHGVTWHGRQTTHGSVVYLPYEGTLSIRLRALAGVACRRIDHLYVIEAREPLSPRWTRDGEERSVGELAVCEALRVLRDELHGANRPPVRLLVIDTARASMTGSEDSSEHVSAYLRAVRRVMTVLPRVAVIIVHHSGWQDGDQKRQRERGSSAWRGNVDGTIYLEAGDYDPDRGEALVTVKTLKTRDGERLPPLRLIRRTVEVGGVDQHGRPITSCIMERDPRTREDLEAGRVEAVESEARALDLRTLRTIAERPDVATSQDNIRMLLGIRKTLVGESLARLVRAGWLHPGRRNAPYQVTATGLATLQESEP